MGGRDSIDITLLWSENAPVAPLGLLVGQDARSTYKTDIGISRGKMPRLRGVVVLRNRARCPTYGCVEVTAYGVCLLLSLIFLHDFTCFDFFQYRFGLDPCFEKEHFAGEVSKIFG